MATPYSVAELIIPGDVSFLRAHHSVTTPGRTPADSGAISVAEKQAELLILAPLTEGVQRRTASAKKVSVHGLSVTSAKRVAEVRAEEERQARLETEEEVQRLRAERERMRASD
jgi:hypothetical protein